MQNKTIIATAAALFAANAFAANAQTSSSPSGSGMTSKDCKGVNACKGQSAVGRPDMTSLRSLWLKWRITFRVGV
jgi:hypothetical protein